MTSSSFKPEFSETNLQFATQNKQIYALLICLGKNKCICETVTYYSVENITNKYVKMRNFLQWQLHKVPLSNRNNDGQLSLINQ